MLGHKGIIRAGEGTAIDLHIKEIRFRHFL